MAKMTATIEIEPLELLALKKLAVICGALGKTLTGRAGIEQRALTSVLVGVLHRADVAASTLPPDVSRAGAREE